MHPSEWMRRLLQPLVTRVRALASRGVVELSNDNHRAQTLDLNALVGETMRKVERFGEFGFVSRPPKDAEVVVLCLGGDRNHPIVIATEYREARPQGLAEGEAGLYAAAGASVVARLTLRANGSIEIEASSVTITGDLVVSGEVSDALGTMNEMRTIYNTHTHTHGGSAGTTAPPSQPMV